MRLKTISDKIKLKIASIELDEEGENKRITLNSCTTGLFARIIFIMTAEEEPYLFDKVGPVKGLEPFVKDRRVDVRFCKPQQTLPVE